MVASDFQFQILSVVRETLVLAVLGSRSCYISTEQASRRIVQALDRNGRSSVSSPIQRPDTVDCHVERCRWEIYRSAEHKLCEMDWRKGFSINPERKIGWNATRKWWGRNAGIDASCMTVFSYCDENLMMNSISIGSYAITQWILRAQQVERDMPAPVLLVGITGQLEYSKWTNCAVLTSYQIYLKKKKYLFSKHDNSLFDFSFHLHSLSLAIVYPSIHDSFPFLCFSLLGYTRPTYQTPGRSVQLKLAPSRRQHMVDCG